jgi:hypothetical protein
MRRWLFYCQLVDPERDFDPSVMSHCLIPVVQGCKDALSIMSPGERVRAGHDNRTGLIEPSIRVDFTLGESSG